MKVVYLRCPYMEDGNCSCLGGDITKLGCLGLVKYLQKNNGGSRSIYFCPVSVFNELPNPETDTIKGFEDRLKQNGGLYKVIKSLETNSDERNLPVFTQKELNKLL